MTPLVAMLRTHDGWYLSLEDVEHAIPVHRQDRWVLELRRWGPVRQVPCRASLTLKARQATCMGDVRM